MARFSHITDFEVRNNRIEPVSKLALETSRKYMNANQVQFAQTRSKLENSLKLTKSLLHQLNQINFTKLNTIPILNDLKILNMNAQWTAEMSQSPNKFIETSLFQSRLGQVSRHLDKLRTRILDTTSRVLVTGDLNAGKSSLCNSLLKRNVLPVDQQPCTQMFCEVVDCSLNANIEEVHAITDLESYSPEIRSSFKPFSFSHLPALVRSTSPPTSPSYKLLKIYLRDPRPANISLLANGVVDIRVIDAPGLNVSQLTTAELFGRQEEIDLVIFVVNAENHFTQSGRDFVTTAANEKSLMFIAVNQIDKLGDKERCKSSITQQIREMAPETYKHGSDHIFFTNSNPSDPEDDNDEDNDNDSAERREVDRLESSVRNFVLNKRSQTKLLPAKTYISTLVADLLIILNHNSSFYSLEREKIAEELSLLTPILKSKTERLNSVQRLAELKREGNCKQIYDFAKLEVSKSVQLAKHMMLPKYPGLLHVISYAKEVRAAYLRQLHLTVDECVCYGNKQTKELIMEIRKMCLEETTTQSLPVGVPDDKYVSTNVSTHGDTHAQFKLQGIPLLTSSLKLTDFINPPKLDFYSVYKATGGLTLLSVLQYLPTNFLSKKFGSKKVAIAIGITTVCAFASNYLQNLHRTIPQNIGTRINAELTSTHFVNNVANQIAQLSSNCLEQPIADLYASFQIYLNDYNRQKLELDYKHADIRGILDLLTKLTEQANSIEREMRGLSI